MQYIHTAEKLGKTKGLNRETKKVTHNPTIL